MSNEITQTQLEEAAIDAQSLEDFVNESATFGPLADGEFQTRLGTTIKTLARISADAGGAAQGPAGADGKTILTGTAAPSNLVGNNGDYFIDKTGFDLYGPKLAGVWGSATSLIGPQGETGAQGPAGTDGIDGETGTLWLDGVVAPDDATDGDDGDFYIDTAAGAIYGPKAGGVWPAALELGGGAGGVGLVPVDFVNADTGTETTVPNKWYQKANGNYLPVYRKVIDTGALGNTTTTSTPHGLTFADIEEESIKLWGTAWDATEIISLPFVFPAFDASLYFKSTNIDITTHGNLSAKTNSRVTIEYSKNTDTEVAAPDVLDLAVETQIGEPANINAVTGDEVIIPDTWFETSSGNYKPMYRKLIDLGTLPNTTTANVAHGLTFADLEDLSITVRGVANSGTVMLPLPYPANGASAIQLYLDATNIVIQTGTNRTAYSGILEIRYAKTTDTAVPSPTSNGRSQTNTTTNFTPPGDLAGWAWTRQGLGVVTESAEGYFSFSAGDDGAEDTVTYVRALTNTTDPVITTAIQYIKGDTSSAIGLCFIDTTGQIASGVIEAVVSSEVPSFALVEYDSATAATASGAVVGDVAAVVASTIWLRLSIASNAVTLEASLDGLTFIEVVTDTVALGTLEKAGFFMVNASGNPIAMTAYHFNEV